MPNLKLNYLYRCAGNYKNFGEAIFSNPNNRTPGEVEAIIRPTLFDGEWFYVNEWGLKDLHFHPWDNELDHTWHEFESIEETTEPPTDNRSIETLLKQINHPNEPISHSIRLKF